ncbi:MAG: hypothetical protein KGI69_02810 [Patescibacteria group bacterium]|nr:hypothetical protein [Patescibacteria group bacterium]
MKDKEATVGQTPFTRGLSRLAAALLNRNDLAGVVPKEAAVKLDRLARYMRGELKDEGIASCDPYAICEDVIIDIDYDKIDKRSGTQALGEIFADLKSSLIDVPDETAIGLDFVLGCQIKQHCPALPAKQI